MVDNYKYLGVIFNERCEFTHSYDVLAKGEGRALGSIISKIPDLKDFSFKSYETLYITSVSCQ